MKEETAREEIQRTAVDAGVVRSGVEPGGKEGGSGMMVAVHGYRWGFVGVAWWYKVKSEFYPCSD